MVKEYDIKLIKIMKELKANVSKYEIGDTIYLAILRNHLAENRLYSKGLHYAKRYRIKEATTIQNSLENLKEQVSVGIKPTNLNHLDIDKSLEERLAIMIKRKKIFRVNFLHDAIVFLQQQYKNPDDVKIYLGDRAINSFSLPIPTGLSNLYQKLFVDLCRDINEQYNIYLQSAFKL